MFLLLFLLLFLLIFENSTKNRFELNASNQTAFHGLVRSGPIRSLLYIIDLCYTQVFMVLFQFLIKLMLTVAISMLIYLLLIYFSYCFVVLLQVLFYLVSCFMFLDDGSLKNYYHYCRKRKRLYSILELKWPDGIRIESSICHPAISTIVVTSLLLFCNCICFYCRHLLWIYFWDWVVWTCKPEVNYSVGSFLLFFFYECWNIIWKLFIYHNILV